MCHQSDMQRMVKVICDNRLLSICQEQQEAQVKRLSDAIKAEVREAYSRYMQREREHESEIERLRAAITELQVAKRSCPSPGHGLLRVTLLLRQNGRANLLGVTPTFAMIASLLALASFLLGGVNPLPASGVGNVHAVLKY